MVDIPFDAVTEILSWLPARSLLQFRCVCRSWYALLHQPGFIKLHLLRANQRNSTLSIFYNHTDNTSYCVDPATSDKPVKLETLTYMNFHGSCNGLVCTSQGSSIMLWNPTTREFKELLPPPLVNSITLEDDRFTVMGFGWDAMKDDYKVLGVQHNWKMDWEIEHVHQLMVYTLRTNSWREISQSTYPLRSYQSYHLSYHPIFLNGGLHWMVTAADLDLDNLCELILSFDMGKEVFKEIHLPEYKKTDFVCSEMGVLQGYLSLVRNLIVEERIDIWIMGRYGVEETWSKKFSIERSQVPRQSFDFFNIKPVGFQRSKLVLAELGGLLISYNTEAGSVEDAEICGIVRNCCYLGHYVETLVSFKAYGDNNSEN